ncbi:hypothetical protein Tco_1362703 [Tanacetum coccineum]
MIIASYLIWKYEGSGKKENYKEVTLEERDWFLYDGEAWMPCIMGLHPAWLLAFRIISFCLLLAAAVSDVAINGTDLFFYYTQWTLSLVTFYFAMSAGAAMLTDSVYWIVIVPFLTIVGYELGFKQSPGVSLSRSLLPLVPNFILSITDCFLRAFRVDSSCIGFNLVSIPDS